MRQQPQDRSGTTEFRRLRWLGVWLPVVSLGALIALVEILTAPGYPWQGLRTLGYLLVMGVITTGAYLFSHSIFRLVQQKEREILQRNQDLAALNAVGSVINESLSFDGVLERVLDKVLDATQADSGEILLWDEAAEALVLTAVRGLYRQTFYEITRFKRSEGFPGRIAETRKGIVVHDLVTDPRFLRAGVKEKGFQSYAGVPLVSKAKVVGVMAIFALDPERLTDDDVGLLEALGRQIGVAVENARLSEQLRAMTVGEERQRIGREMHDGLAQDLGFLHLKMGELEANPSVSSARGEIRQMKKVVSRAYEEARHAIFGLKSMVSRGLGLVPTLAEYLHEFSEQTGIPVKLTVTDEKAARFSPRTEIQLIRIVQEALNNVRRHAHAQEARVTFEVDGSMGRICVEDDGRGFDPSEGMPSGRSSFGLRTMEERATSTGGRLEIESESGRGTRVIAWLPLAGGESSEWRP